MNATRNFVRNELETAFPENGDVLEKLLFQMVCDRHRGEAWDFYSTRRDYHDTARMLLLTLKVEHEGSLKASIQKALETTDVRVGLEEVCRLLQLPLSTWNPQTFKHPDLVSSTDEVEEMRKGRYKCGQCERKGRYKWNTSDFEKQTRSADEPMTVFVTCHTCGAKYRTS